MIESDTLPSLSNISRLARARFGHISELPKVPEFIAKQGTGRFEAKSVEGIRGPHLVRWETRRAGKGRHALRPENLESDRKLQRRLDVFLRCMNALVCDYWNENRDWTRGERGYDTELFSRYAMLLNYLERRSGRKLQF